jgi:hypothetical protein
LGIKYNDFDWKEIQGDFWKICKSEKVCGRCLGKQCLIGYGKACLADGDLREQTVIKNGMSDLPQADVHGGYDEYETLYAMAHLLAFCCSCREGHDPDCLINVCRSTLEIIEFGESLPYGGTPLQHLMQLSELDPGKSQLILEEYQRTKKQQNQEKEEMSA